VFKLGKHRPETDAGQVYYEVAYYNIETNATTQYRKIIDDAGVVGSTLGRRRLRLKTQGVRLHKLGAAVYFLHDLVKLTQASGWYIDVTGRLFEYKKSRSYPLVCKPVSEVISSDTGAVIIVVEGVATRFKVLYRPDSTQRWAGLLKLPEGYMLYGLYDTEFKPTRRKV
jgi:hypothetical protein